MFLRKNMEHRESVENRSYSYIHGWYSSLGATAEEAFVKVRGYVVQVITLASQGDVEGIESFERLGEATKWKIAFHHQNRPILAVVDIFKKAPLDAFVGETAGRSMAALQKTALALFPTNLGILEFGG
ncbi:hypothetical protein [Pseudomonas sp. ANT_J28]|uniref:hypothetical protein n=1 Tax=Pseudomonas sp. ANT_J28 TaxID=2597352 RepID=UPI0011F331D3|nr:hypothetical protein [Pseudomonas sp. ANT_J28]KAA0982066.1 hypothetical protein FQ187_16630 [Pseudomonas sp. ANT_J28]